MAVITHYSKPSLWEEIRLEFEKKRRDMDEDQTSVSTDYSDFDPSKHAPSFYGKMYAHIPGDYSLQTDVNPAMVHPACAGYWLKDDIYRHNEPPTKEPPDPKTCSNREYLDYYVWPYVLPALETTLIQAKKEGCFGLKKVPFNSIDFMTEYLYNKNPRRTDNDFVPLLDIPFVKEWLALHPRPPQPISLTWTEDETAIKIQCVWRGHLVRREPEVRELRRWQKEWRIINREGQIYSEVCNMTCGGGW